MLYHRLLSDEPEGWFVKAFDEELFTDQSKLEEAKRYLEKEYRMYEHLHRHGFKHIPKQFFHERDVLLLGAYKASEGWYWRHPRGDESDRYIREALAALRTLESIPHHQLFADEPTLAYFWQHGWANPDEVVRYLDKAEKRWKDQLNDANLCTINKLRRFGHHHKLTSQPIATTPTTSHHDARQSNIAWHPRAGVIVVDWSWAGAGLEKADTTMFLIDLHKSGIDVGDYLAEFFNAEYASLMMAYWIMRFGKVTAGGNEKVRLHQFLSALGAFELLESYGSAAA